MIQNPQMLITMAGVKTRKQSFYMLSELVGPGKELLTSEVPTHSEVHPHQGEGARGAWKGQD